ncbi:hypothetical protein CPB84DRAFT_1154482 [Gymnopilus junonius]|uniref:Uncharacterized protein n=1 Tax=Gymnopilus junonius TaxID=109634 RepID=A0A9P5NNE6_GYMJU|nr:hypothetical protein CPB84DRAFT_1154482 [Gymnopilus junonius]
MAFRCKDNPYYPSSLMEFALWLNPSCCPFDITHLKGLKITVWNFPPVSEINEVLKLCSQGLEYLELLGPSLSPATSSRFLSKNSEAIWTSPCPRINLGAMQNLREVKIYGYIRYVHGQNHIYESTIPFLFDVLRTLPQPKDGLPILRLVLMLHIHDIGIGSLQWSKVLTGILSQNDSGPRFAACSLRLRLFQMEKEIDVSVSDVSDILDRDEDLRSLRKNGFLTYIPPKWQDIPHDQVI